MFFFKMALTGIEFHSWRSDCICYKCQDC